MLAGGGGDGITGRVSARSRRDGLGSILPVLLFVFLFFM